VLSVRFEADGSSVLHLLARTKRGPQQVPLKGNVFKLLAINIAIPTRAPTVARSY